MILCARWGLAMLVIGTTLAGCAVRETAPPPLTSVNATPSLIGVASWYGPGFDGHRTSSGAIYDQDQLTGASVVFPIGTRLRVINLTNDRTVDITINDHGPYVKGRELDLSHRAAAALGMIGPGTSRVRMEVLESPAGGPAIGLRYYVQVGSFVEISRARSIRDKIGYACPDARVSAAEVGGERLYRVRLGAYPTRHDAESRAATVTSLGYTPIIITE